MTSLTSPTSPTDGRAKQVLKWGLAPLLIFSLAAPLGRWSVNLRRGELFRATASLSVADRTALESVPSLTVANATWALGDVDAVRKMARTEIDRLPESDGVRRSRVFVRFGIVDTNPDGQAALFSQACASDPTICAQPNFKEAARRESKIRFVAPGNMLPLSLMGGHPRIGDGR